MEKKTSAAMLLYCLVGSSLMVWFWAYYGTVRISQALEPYNWLHPGRNKTLFDPKSQILYQGNYSRREVALTIDDGPHDVVGDDLLDLLKREKVKATFFVVGRRASERPDLIRRMANEGHEIGNHSQNHNRLDQLKSAALRSEILGCENIVKGITGKRMALLRPPGMRYNGSVIQTARENGHIVVSWTCAPKDYVDASPTVLVDNVLANVQNGTILLMHDARPMTVTALARVLPALRREGFTFVTITEMLEHLPTPMVRGPNERWEPKQQ